ncbi:MAG: hypothetical protein ACRD6W_17030 [Nitrososphaerales archaeon]
MRPGSECALCSLRTSGNESELTPGPATVIYRDGDVVALAVTGHLGVLLVPRSHVGHLSALPSTSNFLAMLRRAVQAVESVCQVADVSVRPATGLTNACGHAAYWVVMASRGGVGTPNTDAHAETLPAALRVGSLLSAHGRVHDGVTAAARADLQ